MRFVWQSSSPGKIIAFGEFAVLWGQQALALPLPQRLVVYWEHDLTRPTQLSIGEDLFCWDDIDEQAAQIALRYQNYLSGRLPIAQVLQHRGDLLHACLAHTPDSLRKGHLSLRLESQIEQGCGQGSSAALVTAILKGWGQEKIFSLAQKLENYQHGHSSGLDICMALGEKPLLYRRSKSQIIPANVPKLTALSTGCPHSTTGESVAIVTQRSTPELQEFYPEQEIALAIRTASKQHWYRALRLNHRWLVALGVVPQKVQDFISDLELLGGCAKISGAGAISGDHGGSVIALPHPELPALAAHYGYTFEEVQAWGLQEQPLVQ